jgi:hypothetical protein
MFQKPSEFDRTKMLAFFVKDDGFVRRIRGGQFAALIGELAKLGRPAYPFQIAVNKISLGRAANLAARDDMQAHRHLRDWAF